MNPENFLRILELVPVTMKLQHNTTNKYGDWLHTVFDCDHLLFKAATHPSHKQLKLPSQPESKTNQAVYLSQPGQLQEH